MTFLLSSAVVNSALFTLGFLVVMPIFIIGVIMYKAKKLKQKKEQEQHN